MTKIILDIKDCRTCPFFECTGAYTEDSFERPENWWCQHPDVLGVGEVHKKIAGYVDWNDKVPVPEWCPIKVDGEPEENEIKYDPENEKYLIYVGWQEVVTSRTVPGAIEGVKIGDQYVTRIPTAPDSFFATEDDEGDVEFLNKIASKTTAKDLDVPMGFETPYSDDVEGTDHDGTPDLYDPEQDK